MPTTTNLSTLKINYLTQAQYDAALANGQISDDELYFTPNEPNVTINLNGTDVTSPSFYAPLTAGTSGQYLKSNGSGAPTWGQVDFATTANQAAHADTADSATYATSAGSATDNTKLPLAGGTMTGALILHDAPSVDLQAATKKYVDDSMSSVAGPMRFMGTLGASTDSPTVTSIPSAAPTNKGYSYKVITDGTYQTKSAKFGDLIVSTGSEWIVIPSGDEPSGTVINVATGSGLTGGPITTTGTISHAVPSGASSATLGSTASRYYIKTITTDDFGHVTGVTTGNETVANTDESVKQLADTSANTAFPIILAYGTSTAAVTNSVNKTNNFTYNPSTKALTITSGSVTASTFNGALNGNASSATKATGANISSTTNAIAKYSTATGTFANSGVIIDNNNNVTVPQASSLKVGNITLGGSSTTPQNTISSSSTLYLNSGATSSIIFSYNGTKKARFDGSSGDSFTFQPETDVDVSIGSSSKRWNVINGRTINSYSTDTDISSNNTRGLFIRVGNQAYGRMWPSIKGTTSAIGVGRLYLGNDLAQGTADNAKGVIALYGKNKGYTALASELDSTTNYTMYLQNYAGDGYLAHTPSSAAVGGESTPVYVAANGRITACTNISAVDNTKLPLAGGTMTGAVKIKGIMGTSGTDYGDTLPASGTEGQLFFQTGAEFYELPAGGTAGYALVKSSSADRDVMWAPMAAAGPTLNTTVNAIAKYSDTSGTLANSTVTITTVGTVETPGNIWAGNASQTGERTVRAESGAGKILLFSKGSTTGARGIYAYNNAGTGTNVITIDQDNVVTLEGRAIRDGSGNTITSTYVKKSGDTMTGPLAINKAGAVPLTLAPWGGTYGTTGTGQIWYCGTDATQSGYIANTIYIGNTGNQNLKAAKVYGAVWNDYAEYRKDNQKEKQEPGRCVHELGDGSLGLTTKRLQRGCEIISDTFGFAIGQDEKNGYNTPIASNGRVLAYPYESIEEFSKHIGWPVCSGPDGTVSIMTQVEEEKYPSRIVGTISEIPTYEEWGEDKIKVNNRVWIRVR